MSTADFKGLTWAVGSVRGVRAFGVDKLGRLHGVTYRKVWRPGENIAECGKDDDEHADTSDTDTIENHSLLNCGCGFYAYNSKSSDYETGDRIAGVVEGYGKTVLTEKGFRASKARIVALYDPTAPAAAEDAEDDPDGWRRGKPTYWSWFWIVLGVLIFGGTQAALWMFAPTSWWTIPVGLVGGVTSGALPGWNIAAISRAKGMATPYGMRYTGSRYEKAKAGWLDRTLKAASSSSSLDPALVAKVRRNYPDVRWYTDRERMLADFPPDAGPEPTPENTSDFWDRPVPESRGISGTSLGALNTAGLYFSPTAIVSGRRGWYL